MSLLPSSFFSSGCFFNTLVKLKDSFSFELRLGGKERFVLQKGEWLSQRLQPLQSLDESDGGAGSYLNTFECSTALFFCLFSQFFCLVSNKDEATPVLLLGFYNICRTRFSGGCVGLFPTCMVQKFPITPECRKVQKSKMIEKKIDVIISKVHSMGLSN